MLMNLPPLILASGGSAYTWFATTVAKYVVVKRDGPIVSTLAKYVAVEPPYVKVTKITKAVFVKPTP